MDTMTSSGSHSRISEPAPTATENDALRFIGATNSTYCSERSPEVSEIV